MIDRPAVLAIVTCAGLAGLGTGLSVEWLRRWAVERDLLDRPNHRSSHEVPTPRIGGVGLALVMLGGLMLLAVNFPASAPGLIVLAGIGLGVSAVSLYDDIRQVGAGYRFLVHVLAALAVIRFVGVIDAVDAGMVGRLGLASPWRELLTACWVVAVINAVNFIDGIDGMAGAQAAVAGIGWMALASVATSPVLGLAGALLCGAAVGFLWHNWNPARIFMGDGGSALLGFLLATVPWVLGGSALWLASACLLWPSLLDTAWTLVRRAARGEPVWESHRSHIYQQLVLAGRAPSHVSSAYAMASVAGIVVALATLRGSVLGPLVGVASLIGFLSWTVAGRRVVAPACDPAGKG